MPAHAVARTVRQPASKIQFSGSMPSYPWVRTVPLDRLCACRCTGWRRPAKLEQVAVRVAV
jgi:hypothetical protein